MGQEGKHQGVAGPSRASSAVGYITQKKKKMENGRATNLTGIAIGRIGINISTGNRLIFLIRGRRNWWRPRRGHMW